MRIEVIREDAEVLVIDKPPGALSVPSRLGRADPRPCVLYALSAERGGAQVFPVHRLDEEVSGVLLFAKTPDAQRRYAALFEARTARKTYEAWTERRPEAAPPASPDEELRFEDRLHRGKKRSFVAPHGKVAVTRARMHGEVELRGARCLRFELHPETGRSHQLRVQLALRGFPIVGDRLYGATTDFLPEAIALRAVRLALGGRVFEVPDLAAFFARYSESKP